MTQPTAASLDAFPHVWTVEVLARPPLIAPARQYTYPLAIAGEEDALARGALQLLVRPSPGQPAFLATCALGFRDPTMPSGIYSTPNPNELCAVAGGYAYLIDASAPARCLAVSLKPVTSILPLPQHRLLVFSGFHTLCAYGPEGLLWTTARLSWEGVRVDEVVSNEIHGHGWDMLTDREVPFTVEVGTGRHAGGGYRAG